jgi:hypothetical protein
MRRLLLAVLLLLGCASLSHATTYYVSKLAGASNSNACTSPGAGACSTIAGAAVKMSGGDTLFIQAGTYTEAMAGDVGFPWRAGTPTAYTRYARYQQDVVTLRPTSGNYVVIFTEPNRYIELDGLILDGAGRGATVLKTDDTNTNVRIKNCVLKNVGHGEWPNQPMVTQIHGNNHELYNNDLSGSPDGYGIYLAGSNNIIDGNSVHDNGAHGIHAYSDVGGVNNNIFRNNRIYNNGFAGQSFGFSPGMILGSGDGNIAYNNVIYDNWSGIQVAYNGAANTKLHNNTIYNNTGGTSCIYNNSSASGTIIRNNICHQNNGGIVIESGSSGAQQSFNMCNLAGSGCSVVTSNPGFRNLAGFDFHLLTSSAAKDAGTCSGTATVDAEGVTRPQGVGCDIGAYEFAEAEPPPQPPPPGLQAFWKGNSTTDLTGNGHTATMVGGTLTIGASIISPDLTFIFDGVNDHITIAENIAFRPTDLFCVSMWINTTNPNYAYFIDQGNSWGLWHDPQGVLNGYIITSSGLVPVQSSGVSIVSGQSAHIVFTKDAMGLRLYHNDAQVGFNPTTSSVSYTGTPTIYLGRNGVQAQEFFGGRMAYVRFYNDTCDAQAVHNLYVESVPQPNIAGTHLAWINPSTGGILGSVDGAFNHRINQSIAVRGMVANSGVQITEHFPLAVCNVANCESDVDWIQVGAVANALGVYMDGDPVINMGDNTTHLETLDLAGLAYNVGRYVTPDPTIDTGAKTTLGMGVATEWEYRRIRFTTPLAASDQLKFRMLRENGSPLDSYQNTPVLTLVEPLQTLSSGGGSLSGVSNR